MKNRRLEKDRVINPLFLAERIVFHVLGLRIFVLAFLLLLAGLIGSSPAIIKEASAIDGIDSIDTSNYANLRLEYYYYIPEAILANNSDDYPVLAVIPGLSGRGEGAVGPEFKNFAEQEQFIIVAPSFVFDGQNWPSKCSYQYPECWSGRALLEIIAQLEKKNNLRISKFYLFGMSAGAQFALRFCIWKQGLCAACAAHASGGSVKPFRKIDAKFLVTVGRSDDAVRIKCAEEFEMFAKSCGIDVELRTYNTGHELTPAQVSDSLDFFRRNK